MRQRPVDPHVPTLSCFTPIAVIQPRDRRSRCRDHRAFSSRLRAHQLAEIDRLVSDSQVGQNPLAGGLIRMLVSH